MTQDITHKPVVKEYEGREETNGLTLIDARNGFNDLSRLEMLCTVRQHWPLGARLALNYYRHEA